MYKAVIFDFDGVIADTMNDNFLAWEKSFLKYGVSINKFEYFLLEGAGRNEIARFFIEKYKLNPKDLSAIVQQKEFNYKQQNHFKIYDTILDIFNFLVSKNKLIGLVTGASLTRIYHSLNASVLKIFNTIITSDDVNIGKPNPAPYLKAINNLKLLPENCLIIENAQLGIQSAKSAGCQCWALETTMPKEYLDQADLIVNNHLELLLNLKKTI